MSSGLVSQLSSLPLSPSLFFLFSSQLDPQTVETKNWHTDVIEMNGVSWRDRTCLHGGWAARPLAGVLGVLPAPVPLAQPLSLVPHLRLSHYRPAGVSSGGPGC